MQVYGILSQPQCSSWPKGVHRLTQGPAVMPGFGRSERAPPCCALFSTVRGNLLGGLEVREREAVLVQAPVNFTLREGYSALVRGGGSWSGTLYSNGS